MIAESKERRKTALLSWQRLNQWKAMDFFTMVLQISFFFIKVFSYPYHMVTCTWFTMAASQITTFCWFWINQSLLEKYLGVYFHSRRQKTRSSWESQLLGRLIRSLGSPVRKESSGVLKERKEQTFFSKSGANDHTTKQLILLNDMFFLKLCTNDYITTMYAAWGHVSPS